MSMESKLHPKWDPSAKVVQTSYTYSTLLILLHQNDKWISSPMPYYCKNPNRLYRKSKLKNGMWISKETSSSCLDRFLTFLFGTVPNPE